MHHRHFLIPLITCDKVISIVSFYLNGETMVAIWTAEDWGSGYPRCSEARGAWVPQTPQGLL